MQEAPLAGGTLLLGSSLQINLVSALSVLRRVEASCFFRGFCLAVGIELFGEAAAEMFTTGLFSPPGPKSMQDSWCGDDMPLTGSRQTSWEEEEDVEIGMWNSSSSQEPNPSLNWPPYMKKMPTKVRSSSGQGVLSFLKADSDGMIALTLHTSIFILNTL